MIRRTRNLVHAVSILLLIILLPAAARSQDQTPAVEPHQEKTDEGQAPQKPTAVALPEQGKTTSQSSETKSAPSPEAATIYTIKRGDTLWDISNTFLKDPFLWPFIWKANQSITNPDLIYPGNKLTIPSLAPIERAMQAPAKPEAPEGAGESGVAALERKKRLGTAEEGAPPTSRLIVPEEAAMPILDKYSMLSAGYVGDDESKDIIIGGPQGKTVFSYDDIVYVTIHSKSDVNTGEKFIMFSRLNKVKHPITGKTYGRLIKILGVLEITAKDSHGTYTARITHSFDGSEKGTMLMPFQEPTLIYNTPQTKAKDLSGYILEVMDGRTINAQIDIVYLDKGSADGVEPGDRFLVYTWPESKKFPRSLIGETQVILVKEHTSTAIIRKSTDVAEIGDIVEYKK